MKPITLLLTENIDNLGIVGDVVNVKPGFARNFLLPRGYATNPTEENVAALAERRKEVEKEMRLQRQQVEKTFEKLENYELTLERSANEQGVLFGGVSQHDIANALREEGFEIEDRAVRLGEQIKRLDTYMVPLILAADLKTEIKVWVVSDRPVEADEASNADDEALTDDGDYAAEETQPAEA